MRKPDVSRREFVKIAAGAGAALAIPNFGVAAASSKMIGIQVGAISFVDEGTEKVLDVLQERACVNTLFLAVFTYGRGIAGRQIPGQPLPDHGKQEYDLNFHGGNFRHASSCSTTRTPFKDTRAPDHGDLDILAEVLPAAKKRGMKVICWLEDVFRTDLPESRNCRNAIFTGGMPRRCASTIPTIEISLPAWSRTTLVPTTSMESCGDLNGRVRFATVLGPRMTRRRSILAT